MVTNNSAIKALRCSSRA